MGEPAPKRATYEDLYGIPEHAIGEIIAGELIVTPRPSRKHVYTTSALGSEIGPPYQFGRGGPGGWIILVEPEIALGEDILVPDLAGWKRNRFPTEEKHNWISVTPDWVCEVLSASTLRTDKIKKMPLYAQHAVRHIWLIDPSNNTLDVYRLESGSWVLLGSYAENDKISAEPFCGFEFDLSSLWLETESL